MLKYLLSSNQPGQIDPEKADQYQRLISLPGTNTDTLPSSTSVDNSLYHLSEENYYKRGNKGYWTLYFPNMLIDQMWARAINAYDRDKLKGISVISIIYQDKDNKSSIRFFCSDNQAILESSIESILECYDDYQQRYVYYRTNNPINNKRKYKSDIPDEQLAMTTYRIDRYQVNQLRYKPVKI